MPRNAQAPSVQRRVATIQRSSVRPASSAPMANAKGIVETDVAEIEHRRVDDHVRVLEARVEPVSVGGRGLRFERARDGDQQEREEAATRPSTGTAQAITSRAA